MVAPVTSVALGGTFFALAQDALTAGSTQTQAGATPVLSPVARVTTVTTSGDGILLPPSVAGAAAVTLINSGANPCRVYGSGADTINDSGAANGVLQPANSAVVYACTVVGKWYGTGTGIGYCLGIPTFSYQDAVTARSGGGQLFATQVTGSLVRVTTAAAQGDSIQLPTAAAGMEITVINNGANPIQVFGKNGPGDTINGIVSTTGISVGVNQVATFNCTATATPANWSCQLNSSAQPGVLLLSADGAIAPHVAHEYVITKTGTLAALTLAAPTATTDDGLTIIVTSSTAFAHKITATGLLVTGSANVNVATFPSSAGGSLTLMAYQAKWYVQSQVAITFT